MTKYVVPIEFWGVVEADSLDEAFDKVYRAVDCDSIEAELTKAGLVDVEHHHQEPYLQEGEH